MIEETQTDTPMVFLFGAGGIIPEFEENIQGKQVGDLFEFHILADNAYGQADPNQTAMIPVEVFVDDAGKFDADYFCVGAVIPMSDSEGNHLRGTILEVDPEFVKMDFNHPLAGTDLHFSGEIISIRPATPDEIAHGHVHGPGGHHH